MPCISRKGKKVSEKEASSQPRRRPETGELGLGLGVKAVWTVQAGSRGDGMGCSLGEEPNQRPAGGGSWSAD